MKRILNILIIILVFIGDVVSQNLEKYVLQFDKPLYTAGETVWFALLRTDSSSYKGKQEVLHFELISPFNIKILKGKVRINERLGEGYLQLPNDLEEGYYRFRSFTIKNLTEGGNYVYADIPVYSEWNENLTVYKYEEELLADFTNENGYKDYSVDKNNLSFSKRDTIKYLDLLKDLREDCQFVLWSWPSEFKSFPPIQSYIKTVPGKTEISSPIDHEDSLYFEAFLSDPESGDGVNSTLISVYSAEDKRFYRSRASNGWLNLKLPEYYGNVTLQVFNLNPYQQTVNQLSIRQWTVNEGYFNPSKPPVTEKVAEYLIKARQRRKIRDLFYPPMEYTLSMEDSSEIIPDARYLMSDYRYINNLREFIFEAIPGARILTTDEGTETIRLYNPERRSIFVDRPWYIVDGYLTNREEEVLKIPFNAIEELRLYVDTRTIKRYFEYFLWRNGIIEVKTNDVKYLRSLKTDPNYADFTCLLADQEFFDVKRFSGLEDIPDLRTTIIWATGRWTQDQRNESFALSDDRGKFTYRIIAVSDAAEVMKKEGEFEVH